MKPIIFILTFAVSAGLSSLGIISSYRLKQQNHSFASSLFYYKVFLVAFGFYGIWSHLFFNYLAENALLSGLAQHGLVGIFPILGIPLLIVAWYLFVKFCSEISSKRFPMVFTAGYFISLIIIFLLVGLYFQKQLNTKEIIDLQFIIRTMSVVNLSFIVLGGIILLSSKRKTNVSFSSIQLLAMEVIPFILFSIALFMLSSHWFMAIITIMFYFSAIAILPALLYFKTSGSNGPAADFNGFCAKYEISKREAEIIREICKGKTNQEIADSLYITLQTVKDHTHRIYLKTRVSNRVQLTNLVNEAIGSTTS